MRNAWHGAGHNCRRTIVLVAGAAIGVLLVILYTAAVRTADGQELDIVLFARAQGSNEILTPPASVLRNGLPIALFAAYLALVTSAIWNRRWRVALTTLALVAGSLIIARWLRTTALGRPFLGDHGYTENTFPSGHVALTAALAVSIVALWMWAGRRLVIVGSAATIILACAASVVGHAHRPSDVVGSVLLVGALACLIAGSTGLSRRAEVTSTGATPVGNPPGGRNQDPIEGP